MDQAPLSPERRKLLTDTEAVIRQIAALLRSLLPKEIGFVLVFFEFGSGGLATYASNAQRADMVKALRECADKLERIQDLPHTIAGN